MHSFFLQQTCKRMKNKGITNKYEIGVKLCIFNFILSERPEDVGLFVGHSIICSDIYANHENPENISFNLRLQNSIIVTILTFRCLLYD